jgi:hypothetical protein
MGYVQCHDDHDREWPKSMGSERKHLHTALAMIQCTPGN